MANGVCFIAYQRIAVGGGEGMKNILLDIWHVPFDLRDKLLYIGALRGVLALRKFAGAPKKTQPICFSPAYNIALADGADRADKPHALKMIAFYHGQHTLDLTAEKHTHDGGFYDVVKIMTEGDFVAAEGLRCFIQPTAAFLRADETGRFFGLLL